MERLERLLLKPQEVAEVIGLGRSKTYELIQQRAIPSIRIGRSVRVHVEALRAWLDEQVKQGSRHD